ncbi:MAG: putative CheA signal transduction histidine kinase [Myxococcales bacterium]|nr:putative CheA signal transduction histidine kinase [Myxococcales bacterium]
MGFADLFRPKWKHSNPEVRAEAVRQLGDDEAVLLATIAKSDSDARVRRIAVKRIADADVLTDVAAHDPDEGLRKAAIEKAEEVLLTAAANGDGRALDALAKLNHPRLLATVAHKSSDAAVRLRAVELIIQAGDDKALADVVKRSTDVSLRKLGVDKLRDPGALRDIAISDGNKEVALAAVARLSDRAALDKVVNKAQSKAVRQAARDKLPAPEKKIESPEAQKRATLLGLVRVVEQAGDPHELEEARAAFSAAGPDDEMRRRFDRACERFYAKRAATVKKPAAVREKVIAQLAATPPAQAVAPLAVPAPVQPIVEATPVVAVVDPEDEKRRAEREADRVRREQERQRRDADKAEARARREGEEKANLERLTQLTVDLEGVAVDDLGRGSQAIKRAQQAFDALGPLGRDAAPVKARWQAARDKLRARLSELREAEDWKRWALVPKLEALCVRVEALLEKTDLKEAAVELKALHAEWKAVGPTTKDKQEQLWQRFKAAADQVHERTRAQFAVLDEQRVANLARKEELAARVEKLADSTDWKETSELIKALQEEWKAVGPTPKDKGDDVWKRFRGACDKFFDARKAQFEAGDAERQAHLQRQLELCAAVEKLVAATTTAGAPIDWKRTGDEIKAMQAEWKEIGPVPREKAEDTWKRFRGTCDKFFDARKIHFDKMDEERGGNLKAKELLCERVEALADAPDAEEAQEIVRQLQAEWKSTGPAPKDKADEVWDRFRGACDKIYERARRGEPATTAAAAPDAKPMGYSAPKLGDLLKK